MADPPAIERAFLREAADGTTVFFPWGLTHRGYVLRGEEDRKRVSRAAALLIGGTTTAGVWAGQVLQPLFAGDEAPPLWDVLRALAMPTVLLLVVLGGYTAWASRLIERLPESPLRVSREERLYEAAQWVAPWKVAAIGVTVVALGALLLWLDPRAAVIGWLGVAIGVGALLWSRELGRAAAKSASPCAASRAPQRRIPR